VAPPLPPELGAPLELLDELLELLLDDEDDEDPLDELELDEEEELELLEEELLLDELLLDELVLVYSSAPRS